MDSYKVRLVSKAIVTVVAAVSLMVATHQLGALSAALPARWRLGLFRLSSWSWPARSCHRASPNRLDYILEDI